MTRVLAASLTRISDFDSVPFDVDTVEQSSWATGDFVVAEVVATPSGLNRVEDRAGRMLVVRPGDRVIGGLGCRAATLEGVGSWRDVRDGSMQMLTAAGLFGAFTSYSFYLPEPISLRYAGHVCRSGAKVVMRDFALTCHSASFDIPTVLLVGTSMSAGKTTTGRLACELLSRAGFRVCGVKMTGAGRYRDILSYRDAGALDICDFVDVGLPSTIVPESEFRQAIRPLLSRIASCKPDVAVVEAGASPLEPYNGAAAISELGGNVRCRILCASDPYAVVGVQEAFGFQPDLVAGPAANTSAAIELVEKLSGLRALSIADPDSIPEFRRTLASTLDLDLGG